MKEADCNGNIRNSKEVFTPHTSSGCHCQTHDKKHPHHFSNSESHEHSHSESEGAEKLNVRTFIGSSISLLMLILGLMMSHFDIFDFADNIIFRLIWYIVAFLPVGLPVMKEAIEGIIAHDFFNEFTLMSIACIGAFCIKEFPEAGGVMLF